MDLDSDQQIRDPTPEPSYHTDLSVRTESDLPTFDLTNDL